MYLHVHLHYPGTFTRTFDSQITCILSMLRTFQTDENANTFTCFTTIHTKNIHSLKYTMPYMHSITGEQVAIGTGQYTEI